MKSKGNKKNKLAVSFASWHFFQRLSRGKNVANFDPQKPASK
jgi:hypothetical protein